MGAPISTSNALFVQAFQSRLLHQSLFLVVLLAALALAWNLLRAAQLRRAGAGGPEPAAPVAPEPAARLLLRVTFGLIWIFDGVLQGQASMPAGLADQVVKPAADGSPSWVVHLVNAGALIWNNHPIEAAVSAVWIQVGIGLWILVAPRGRWSQLGGAASAGWAALVWAFGEAFGGVFAPGGTFLFGYPGAALCYLVAGGLIALPERAWSGAWLRHWMLRGFGFFLLGMAILQAWPDQGFWYGRLPHRQPGAIASMALSMAQTPQPGFIARAVNGFASFDEAHGFVVNLAVVVALGLCGAAFVTNRRALIRPALLVFVVFSLLDWVLVEDFGFFGGLGTDPNSMIPMALLAIAGTLALLRAPAAAEEPARAWRERFSDSPSYALRLLAAGAAVLVTVLGAAPMALASANGRADAIVTEAVNGAPQATDAPAPGFTLLDPGGRAVSLTSLRGKAVAMTFLDPVCTTDCPLIAQEFAAADRLLGPVASRVELVAVVANPIYRSTAVVADFDRQEGLDRLRNWTFLTGSERALANVWDDYGVQVEVDPAGAMVNHSDVAFVIGPNGDTRFILNADPGPGTASSQSSFASLLATEIESALGGR